jgi:hypothetical protein
MSLSPSSPGTLWPSVLHLRLGRNSDVGVFLGTQTVWQTTKSESEVRVLFGLYRIGFLPLEFLLVGASSSIFCGRGEPLDFSGGNHSDKCQNSLTIEPFHCFFAVLISRLFIGRGTKHTRRQK